MVVRFAEPEDAGSLAAITAPAFGPLTCNWTDEDTNGWLVAETDHVVGALQVLLGRPVGRLEVLSLDKELPVRQRHKIMTELMTTGIASLMATGSQYVIVNVGDGSGGFRRFIKKRFGFIYSDRVNMYLLGV